VALKLSKDFSRILSWRFEMRMLLRFAIVFLVLGAPARAAEDVEVGLGPICDTQKQAERLAALYRDDAHTAIQTVNAEEHDPSACGVANVAYIRSERIATVRTEQATFEIARVLVVGIVTRAGMRPTKPLVYYSFFPVDERGA
jgi:hypothetical protein